MLLLWRRPHAATTNQCHWTISLGPACHHSLTNGSQHAMKSSMMLLQRGDTIQICTNRHAIQNKNSELHQLGTTSHISQR